MKYKAVIFDLDGTLLDTIDDLADSMNSVLCKCNFNIHDVEKYKYFVGDGLANLVRRALPPDKCEEKLVEECLSSLREEYGARWAAKTKPYKGIPELLDALTQKGLKLAVLSNKPDEFTRVMIAKLLEPWKFDIVFGERLSVPKKPDPSGAIEIAEFFGLSPDEILYLGDTNTDMKTANAAGMYAVGVLWGFRKRDELEEHGAKYIIENPMELMKLIE